MLLMTTLDSLLRTDQAFGICRRQDLWCTWYRGRDSIEKTMGVSWKR